MTRVPSTSFLTSASRWPSPNQGEAPLSWTSSTTESVSSSAQTTARADDARFVNANDVEVRQKYSSNGRKAYTCIRPIVVGGSSGEPPLEAIVCHGAEGGTLLSLPPHRYSHVQSQKHSSSDLHLAQHSPMQSYVQSYSSLSCYSSTAATTAKYAKVKLSSRPRRTTARGGESGAS
jgi:hypothetical protein